VAKRPLVTLALWLYPSKPLRIVVSCDAGRTTDRIARLVRAKLSERARESTGVFVFQ
jgi:tripartite-type tricarboxylate transporter receptor subunit TctC